MPFNLKVIVAACAISLLPGIVAAKTVTLRVASELAPSDPVHHALVEFSDNVNKRSEGRLNVNVFPSSQLGSNRETYEQVRQGAPIIQLINPGYLATYIPDFGILNGPYLIDDPRDFNKILDSEWYDSLKKQSAEKGFHPLAVNYFFGKRHMLGDKPYPNAQSLEGVTMRLQPNPVAIKTFEALGVRGVALPWMEVYSGLGQNVIEALEAPFGALMSAKLQEQRKDITLTGHFTEFLGLAMNEQLFNSLEPDLQEILTDEAIASGNRLTEVMLENEKKLMAELESQGVTITKDVDIDSYREATRKVYSEFSEWTPGAYEQIQEILNQ